MLHSYFPCLPFPKKLIETMSWIIIVQIIDRRNFLKCNSSATDMTAGSTASHYYSQNGIKSFAENRCSALALS